MGMGAGLMGLPFQAAGSIMGAQAADQAQQQNQEINDQNFMLQLGAQHNQQQQAEQQRNDALAQQTRDAMGATDAQGNHTYFDPVKGWTTSLSYAGQQQQKQAQDLNTAQNQEKMTELNNDVPIERQQMNAAALQNNSTANQADAFSRMLHDAVVQGPSKTDTSQLYAAQQRGINDGFNAEQEDAARTAIRSGASNAGAVVAQLAKARSDALQQASVQDAIGGRQQDQQDYQSKIGNLASLVQSFQQASRSPLNPAQYDPSNATSFTPQSAASGSQFASMMQQSDPSTTGDPAIIQAAGLYPTMDYVQPNYGDADAAMGIGKAFSGLGGSGSSGGGLSNLSKSFMGNSGVF